MSDVTRTASSDLVTFWRCFQLSKRDTLFKQKVCKAMCCGLK